MAHEDQESADAQGFPEQPDLVVACGAMGLVEEQQAEEVNFGALLGSGGGSSSIPSIRSNEL